MKNSNTVPYVLLTFSAFFWAASSVVGRYVAGEVPAMALNFCRWFLALAVVLTWTWKEIYENRALIRQKWKYFSFLAISSAIGFGALHFIALQYTGAINGALLQGLMPICILLTALVVLGDPFGAREMIGIALGFLGITCIVTQGRLSVLLGMSFNIGDIMLLVGTVSWSIYAVYLRRAPSVLSASTLMALMFAFAALYTFPLWMIETFVFDYVLPLNSKALWAIAFMTIGPSVLAQIFWAYSVSRVGPGKAGYFIYLAPVFGVLLATQLLGEIFYRFHAVGIALIFTGIWLATRQQRQRTGVNT